MIEIRNFQHTNLEYTSFIKMLKKYIKNLKLKENIVVIFDKRLKKVLGLYRYNIIYQQHQIQLNPLVEKKDKNFIKWTIISSLIHELKHASQIEKMGFLSTSSNKFYFNNEIKEKEGKAYFSKSEIEARIYENKNTIRAINFYNNYCKIE